jgi:hypothetical protein
MPHRPLTPSAVIAALLLATFIAGEPASAQSGAKVLTPPKPADTARQPAAAKGPATSTATTAPTAVARPPLTVPQNAVLDSIREAVFRSLLDRDRSGFATLASAFCLALSNDDFKAAPTSPDRVDAPESLVRRVASARMPTRRASTCLFTPNTPGRPVMGRALLYTVGAIGVNDSRAEAAAAYYDAYGAGGFTFSVERSDSGWVVKQWRQEWTSKPAP